MVEFDAEMALAELEQMRILCTHHIRHADAETLRQFITVLDQLKIFAEREYVKKRTGTELVVAIL